MGVRLSNPLADQVAELEEDYAKCFCVDFKELELCNEELNDELEWYRSTFPEGADAYACMRRME